MTDIIQEAATAAGIDELLGDAPANEKQRTAEHWAAFIGHIRAALEAREQEHRAQLDNIRGVSFDAFNSIGENFNSLNEIHSDVLKRWKHGDPSGYQAWVKDLFAELKRDEKKADYAK